MEILGLALAGLGGLFLWRRFGRGLPTYALNGRSYALYAPTDNPTTLIVLLHGAGGSTRSMQGRGWERVAERVGAVLVFPEGLPVGRDGKRVWNHRGDAGLADDAAFLSTLIGTVQTRYPSARRVVLVGYSNGGGMAYRLAAEQQVAGLVVVSSTIRTDNVTHTPRYATPLVLLHGDRDTTMPWRGGVSDKADTESRVKGALAEAVNAYRGVNHADGIVPVTPVLGVDPVWHQRWAGRAPVEILVDRKRGHELPAWNWAGYAWRALGL